MTSDYLNQRREEEIKDSIDVNRSTVFGPISAGIGAIAIGAAIYSTKMAGGGRLISNLLHFLGHPRGVGVKVDDAANIAAAAAKHGTSGIRSLLTSNIDASSGSLMLGPIDLIDDARSALEVINASPRNIARRITNRFSEYVNRKFANRATSSYFTHDLQRITIEQVLADQKNWSAIIGEEQWSVLNRARNAGLVSGERILDNKIFTAPSGTIRDLRISSIFTRPVKVRGPSGDYLERAPILDMFGQGKVISGLLGKRRGFAVLASDNQFTGSRFFIDGDIYGFRTASDGSIKEYKLATNRTLISSDSPLIPVQEAREGSLQYRINKRNTAIGKAGSKFEMTTGVGRSFASRPSFIERFIVDPIKRYRAIASGDAVIFKHPNRYGNPFNKAADAMMGGDMPEAVFRHGTIQPVKGGDSVVNLDELSFLQRLGVIFDMSDTHSVVKTEKYMMYAAKAKQKLENPDLIVPRRDKGIAQRNTRFYNKKLAQQLSDVNQASMNSLGIMDETLQAKFTDVPQSTLTGLGPVKSLFPGMTSIRTLLNYSVYRVSALASEAGLGIAFAPAKTLIGNVARMAAIPLIYEAGKESIGYADFLSEEYLGISPIKTAASIYAGARELQQKFRSALGIQQTARAAEENYPGSVESEGSTVLRSLVAPLGAMSYLLGKGRTSVAVAAAAAIYAAVGGTDVGQTAEELKDEYLGETKVPVRKGRLWGLGYLPFFGGEVDYYDFSWYHKLQTDYRTKSLYGSRSEYYQYHANVLGVPLPTPHNLFGVKNILNPYRFEELNINSRPYEVSGSSLEEFPIVGPLLSATIGRLIKPKMNRQMNMPLLEAGLVQRGLDSNTAQILGMSKLDVSESQIVDPHDISYRMNKLANVATEPLGVYKFVMEFFGVKFGKETQPVKASSDLATSAGRELYDAQLGGLLGQTEFIRRFFLSDYYNAYKNSDLVNNIRNNMPDWMPGQGSKFKLDQQYYIDFTAGDPYIKLAAGEARLPGAGYEALNKLHSGKPGEYSDVDKFLVLSDVAPYSQAYRTYANKVSNMNLDPYWQKKVDSAFKQRQESIGVDTRYLRYNDTLGQLNQGTKDSALYQITRKAYDTFTHDFLAELPYVGSKLFPFRDPYEQYRKLNVEGSEFASWDRPFEGVIRPMITDMASVNPVMAAIKGAGVGALLAGPMKWFNPFSSTVEHWRDLSVRGALFGASLSLGRIANMETQDFVPSFREQESNAAMYMDAINYLKYRSLAETAEQSGSPAAGELRRMTGRTMLGARSPIMLRSTLPSSADRKYFEYFLNVPENERSKIYSGVPGYMKEALAKGWSKDYNNQDEADARASQILSEIPNQDWIGWRPDIPMAATKIHLVKHGINGVSDNYHRFGFYESQENDILSRIPNFNDYPINYATMPQSAQFTDLLAFKNKGYLEQFGGVSASAQSYNTAARTHRQYTVTMDRSNDTKAAVNQYVR